MVKKATRTRRSRGATKRRPRPEVLDEEERILRAATIHLITKHGMFLVATGAREVRIRGLCLWIISVTLRYSEEDEGYIGELLFDGKDYTFLTPSDIMDERVRQVADNPDRIRRWNEYRASVLLAGKT